MSTASGASERTIVVTGAAGFIGYHVAERLLADGHAVLGVDNLSPYYDVALKEARLAELRRHAAFRFLRLDLADREAVAALFDVERPELVVHLAAQAGVRYSIEHPHAYVDSNLVGFVNVLEGCRGTRARHLLFASSSSVYGANRRVPFSEHHGTDHPISLYAATKKANELLAHSYSHIHGLPVTGLRFFTVYGPWGRPDMAISLFTKAILEGRPIDVFNGGAMCRDFTYVDDVVDAIVRLLPRPPAGDPAWRGDAPDPASSEAPYRIYNIGNHRPVELDRLIALLEGLLGRPARRRSLPMQPGDVPMTFADVADLAAAVDYAPHTPLEDGLARFVSWFTTYYGYAR